VSWVEKELPWGLGLHPAVVGRRAWAISYYLEPSSFAGGSQLVAKGQVSLHLPGQVSLHLRLFLRYIDLTGLLNVVARFEHADCS